MLHNVTNGKADVSDNLLAFPQRQECRLLWNDGPKSSWSHGARLASCRNASSTLEREMSVKVLYLRTLGTTPLPNHDQS